MKTVGRAHVLAVIDGLGWGGAEMLLPEFVRAAPAVGIDVSVAYLREKVGSPAAVRLRELGIEPHHLGIGGLLVPTSLQDVYRHVGRLKPDLVHTHLEYSDILGGLAAGLHGIPVVSTIHLSSWDRSGRNRIKLQMAVAVRGLTASRIVAVSDAVRRAYVSEGWGSTDRVMTVHNGIAGDRRAGAGRSVRAELGVREGDLIVGMLSVLRADKRHSIAIEAVRQLRPEFPDLRLVIVGDGPARAEVDAAAAALGEAVILAGPRHNVMEVLDAFDVLLLPSAHEAFPTVLLEAMAACVPIVAAGVGGVPEIVRHGETGTLVDGAASGSVLAGALRPYLNSRALRVEHGLAGRRRFEAEFTAAVWTARLRELYDRILRERPLRLQRLCRAFRGRPEGRRRFP